MKYLTITIVADGTSDACLIPIVDWILREVECAYRVDFARGLPSHSYGLRERVKQALNMYPCDILIVHRDVERGSVDDRIDEIKIATDSLCQSVVMATPKRMIEAWLVIDETAIRQAAGNPNGDVPFNLPSIKRVEDEPDPKFVLLNALRVASELRGRRLEKFYPEQRRLRVAELINDYSSLRALKVFRDFESDLLKKMNAATKSLKSTVEG